MLQDCGKRRCSSARRSSSMQTTLKAVDGEGSTVAGTGSNGYAERDRNFVNCSYYRVSTETHTCQHARALGKALSEICFCQSVSNHVLRCVPRGTSLMMPVSASTHVVSANICKLVWKCVPSIVPISDMRSLSWLLKASSRYR